MAKRAPTPGERVRVKRIFPEEATIEGVVVDLLSRQFTYRTDKGHVHFAFYEADYETTHSDNDEQEDLDQPGGGQGG